MDMHHLIVVKMAILSTDADTKEQRTQLLVFSPCHCSQNVIFITDKRVKETFQPCFDRVEVHHATASKP